MLDPGLLPYYDPLVDRKVALVTNASRGSGYYTALHLYLHGFIVYIGCSFLEQGETIISLIKEDAELRRDPAIEEHVSYYIQYGSTRRPVGDIKVLEIDLLNLKSVELAANRFKSLETTLDAILLVSDLTTDIPYFRTISDDFEVQFQSNYISLFLFTQILLPLVAKKGRIVYVSSLVHWLEIFQFDHDWDFDYEPNALFTWLRYAKAKSCGIKYMEMLNSQNFDINCFSIDPGSRFANNVQSPNLPFFLEMIVEFLFAFISFFIGLGEEDSSYAGLYCLLSLEDRIVSKNKRLGNYFTAYGYQSTPSFVVRDKENMKKNWDWTIEKLKEKGYTNLENDIT